MWGDARGVEAGEGGQERRDDGDQLPAVLHVPRALLQDEEGGLRVDSARNWSTHRLRCSSTNTAYANMWSYSASEMAVMGFLSTMPTVLTTMSIFWCCAMASAKSFSTAAAVPRSPAWSEMVMPGLAWASSSRKRVVSSLLFGEL